MKSAVSTAPEPDAMICWTGFIGADAGSVAISEEEQRCVRIGLPNRLVVLDILLNQWS